MKARGRPYEICRRIRDYHRKNGYAIRVSELGLTDDELEAFKRNGVVQVLPLYEGGPALGVVLTDKGMRMAEAVQLFTRSRRSSTGSSS